MKRLTPQQIEGLVRLIGQTSEHEFNCAECQRYVSALDRLLGMPRRISRA
jgi:hypothetical protein